MPKNEEVKGKYFRLLTCSKCGQGEGTLQKDGLGGYRHVKCPPKKQMPMIITNGRV